MRKFWSDDKIEYLMESVGKVSFVTIAKNLGTTIAAVERKAHLLGINNARAHCEYITANEFSKAIGVASSTIGNWHKAHGLPFLSKKLRTTFRFQLIDIDAFWKWADVHQNLIDTRKWEKNSIGEEPDWMVEKRKADATRPKNEASQWTTLDEKMLIQLYLREYTREALAERFNRSVSGIQRKIDRLKAQGRLPIDPKGNFVKDDELQRMITLRKEGLSYAQIGIIVGRPRRTVYDNLKKHKEAV